MAKQISSDSRIKVLPAITAAACAFLAAGVMLIFHACGPKDDGTWMSCHYAQLTVFAFALVMTVLSLAAVFTGRRNLRTVLYIAVMACAVISAVIPQNVIRLCMMPEMRCRAVMRPVVILMDVLIVLLSASCMAAEFGGKKRRG